MSPFNIKLDWKPLSHSLHRSRALKSLYRGELLVSEEELKEKVKFKF